MMMTPMAELEIDDVAFLAGDPGRSHTNCETCQCIYSTGLGTGGSRSRRSFGSGAASRGISSLLSTVCPSSGPFSRPAFLLITIVLGSLALLLIAFLVAFSLHPMGCSSSSSSPDHDLDPSSSSSDSSSSSLPKKPEIIMGSDDKPFPWQDIRLPQSVHPIHYDLFMHPNLTSFMSKGTIEVILNVKDPITFIVMHVKDLNVSEIHLLSSKDDRVIPITRFITCKSHEQLYIQLRNPLIPSQTNYTLKVTFSLKLEHKLEGFYISSYHDTLSDRKRYLATTHFEPTAARSAFPCFDEPAFKATFSLKMVHEAQHDVFFNSDKETTELYTSEGLKISVFEETVKMSTYLVAFSVCDFKSVTTISKEGVHIRVLAPADQTNQVGYALNSASRILSYFQDFFTIPYPLSKLDLMAVPDFAAGAMENWGLITFRTTMILYNDKESSSKFQEEVATVISHELAHQWFGNLVTMEWWSDLWLNEGFASFIQNLGVDRIHPEWRMLDQFVVSTTQDALALDSLETSHPIMSQVKNTSEIEAIFDVISYKKGSALIRMLENFLGYDVLRQGLGRYLRKYQFKNAKTRDLWQSFTEVVKNSSINVTAVMDRWVKQKGYPVISSKLEKNRLFLGQKRFLSVPAEFADTLPPIPESMMSTSSASSSGSGSGDDPTADHGISSPFGYQWIVPITLITSRSPNVPKQVWLSQSDASLAVDPNIDWFKINVNQSGFYRVNYDDTNWRRLIDLLHSHQHNLHILSAPDRSNLLDDALSFMKVSHLSADLAMNLTAYLELGERDYVPWETALMHFSILDAIMGGNPLLRKYLVKLLKPTLSFVGWHDEGDHLKRKLRSSLLQAAVTYGEDATIQTAKKQFDDWSMNRRWIPPNMRQVVYTTGVRSGGSREWDICWKKYTSSKIASEKKLLLEALASTRIPWLLNHLLTLSLQRDVIKTQDTVQVITDVANNPDGRLIVWRFVRDNWAQLLSLQGLFPMDQIISGVTFHFSTTFDYTEVVNFFSSTSSGSGAASGSSQAVKQSLERIRANIYWKRYVEPQVISWLTNKQHLSI